MVNVFISKVLKLDLIFVFLLFLYLPLNVFGKEFHVKVCDTNSIAVPDAIVCQGADFKYDVNTAELELISDTKSMIKTDANGDFIFKVESQFKNPRFLFITNRSLTQMGYLRINPYQEQSSFTAILDSPSRIKTIVKSNQTPLPFINIDVQFTRPEKPYRLYGCMKVKCDLNKPLSSVLLDIPCPSKCNLSFKVESDSCFFSSSYKAISPILPAQVKKLDPVIMGERFFKTLLAQKAPVLQISEWAKGTPVTIEDLKGKVILLDFWALWCSSCKKMLPELVDLHEKYHKSGLEIISIHDSSEDKQSLLSKYNLSNLPFRVAIDSHNSNGPEMAQGCTINSYKVLAFPHIVLISQNGIVESIGRENLEKRIRLLLGKKDNVSEFILSRMLLKKQKDINIIIASCILIIVLAVYFSYRLYRHRN